VRLNREGEEGDPTSSRSEEDEVGKDREGEGEKEDGSMRKTPERRDL